MQWVSDSRELKSLVNRADEYNVLIAPFRDAEVLYIDDFFKAKDTAPISDADVRLAFDLISYRDNRILPTIISTEKRLKELRSIDESVGGRIYQNCHNDEYRIELNGADKNQRFKNQPQGSADMGASASNCGTVVAQ